MMRELAFMARSTKPMRLALLSLSLELYQRAIPGVIPKYEAFHKTLKDKLAGFGEVAADQLCFSRQEVESAVRLAETAGADVLVIVLQSYHPSLNSLSALMRTSLPILIWNTQNLLEVGPDYGFDALTENHGMHGVQDLCNVPRRSGRTYGLVSGHFEDPRHIEDLGSWLRACGGVSFCRRMKVGLLGRPFLGMGDFGVDETRMLASWGPATDHLTLAELAEQLALLEGDEIDQEIARDHELFEFQPEITEEDHLRSARLSVALRKVVESHQLDAVTMHFGVYGEDPRIETCPFLGFNHLIAQGYGYAGEGNVTIAALDALLTRVFGRSNFCEMFTADYKNDQVLFYHMGEGNYAMARRGTRPILKKVPYTFGDGQPCVVPIYAYEPGPSTFVNLTTEPDGRFYLIAFEGEVTDYTRLDALNAPQFKIQTSGRLGDFLDQYGFHGGTHHLSRVEGRQLKQLGRLARMLGMELKTI